MSRSNDYATGNLLDYDYFSKYYKLVATDFCKQIELEDPDLKLKLVLSVVLMKIMQTMFLIIEKSDETTLIFSENAVTVV